LGDLGGVTSVVGSGGVTQGLVFDPRERDEIDLIDNLSIRGACLGMLVGLVTDSLALSCC